MRYPPEQKEKTRLEILDVAGRVFRERGYDGIGVDGVAAEAQLTSGALYKHFRSKSALFREVLRLGLVRLAAGINRFQQQGRADWLPLLADWYMSAAHRADLGKGCALPSLSPEVVKADSETRSLYQEGLLAAVTALMRAPPFRDAKDGRQHAWATLALLAGGVTLSRAVADPALADEIASAVRDVLAATGKDPS
ncbi:MAG: TetR/AcrR family transcriptional regulator [Alphaproteobacteria bacterium]|nr:TetR/AcrR family transcriptional regulator [Alphaproteobacteria bacterium]